MTHPRRTWLTVAAVGVLAIGLAASPAAAVKLDDTAIFIEINDTDGDAGIQLFLDGEGWKRMKLFDPDGNKVLDIRARGSIGLQGITELFFESAEPSFEVQSLDELLGLFPAGRYTFAGTTTDGRNLKGKARLSHALPAAPLQVFPVEGDEVDPDNTVLEWALVADPPGSEIVGYEVIVEAETDDELRVFKVDVGPDTTTVNVPPQFMAFDGEEFKWEVLAIEASGNQTISESEFGKE